MSRPSRIFSHIKLPMVGLAITLVGFVHWQDNFTPAREQQAMAEESDSLSVDYSRACLRLAQAELAEALEQNRRFANSVTDYDLARLRLHVRSAQQNVSYAEQGADHSQTIIGHVELQAELAQLDLEAARRLRKKHQDSVSDAQLERLRVYAQVCELRAQLVRNPVSALTLMDHLHWETHRLSEELLLLNRRVERLEETARQ